MIGGLSYFSIDSERVSGDDDHSGRTFADFAVLYRLGAQSQPLVEAFHRSGIPYQTVGQTPLAAHKEIKTILACLWLLHQPDSRFHLEQVAPKKQLPNVEAFLDELRNKVTTQPVSISIEQIYQFLADHTGFRVDEKSDDRIQQLMLRAAPFENRLEGFLEEVMLQKETDIYDPRADRVTLMTLHASKGLEFPVGNRQQESRITSN